MPRTHNIDGKKIKFSAAEEIAEDAREAKRADGLAHAEWKRKISGTDRRIPRWAEDLFDVLTDAQKAALAPETRAKIDHKKTVRAAEPAKPV